MFEHHALFSFKKRSLGERRKHVGIGMLDGNTPGIQSPAYDLGYLLHSSFHDQRSQSALDYTPPALSFLLPEHRPPPSSLRTLEMKVLAPGCAEYPPEGHGPRHPGPPQPAGEPFPPG